jgi:hypothetical protein
MRIGYLALRATKDRKNPCNQKIARVFCCSGENIGGKDISPYGLQTPTQNSAKALTK